MKYAYLVIAVVTIFLTVFSCTRKDFFNNSNVTERNNAIRSWLHEKGGAYKDESITIGTQNGKVTMKLNWGKATTYKWRGVDFVDIPFTTPEGQSSLAEDANANGCSFNMVVRRYNNGEYRAAIRTTTHSSSTSGNREIQDYKMLDGRQMNVWFHDNSREGMFAATPVVMSASQFRTIALSSKSHSPIMSANVALGNKTIGITKTKIEITEDEKGCIFTRVKVYDSRLTSSPGSGGDGFNDFDNLDPVTLSSYMISDKTYKMCPTSGPTETPPPPSGGSGGDGGGGGGGGNNNNSCSNEPPHPPPMNPDGTYPPYSPPTPCEEYPPVEPQKEDPCANAKKLAALMQAALNDPTIKEHLADFITQFVNSNVEHGFAIYKKADGTFGYTNTVSGDGNHIEWTFDAGLDYVTFIHIHPPGGSAIPSPTDYFGLAGHLNPNYAGSLIISGNDKYMISITNSENYTKFISKKSQYYDSSTASQWKDKSSIYKSYQSFLSSYMQMYPGQDAVFPTQLYLMKDFKMGVSVQKSDIDNNFSPITINAQYNMSSGSSVTLGGGVQPINSPYSSITVEPDCN